MRKCLSSPLFTPKNLTNNQKLMSENKEKIKFFLMHWNFLFSIIGNVGKTNIKSIL